MITGPGAAMLDAKLFVARLDGSFRDLYERWWDGDEWVWVHHGRPNGLAVTGVPGAAMMNQKLFIVVDDGSLWERHWHGTGWAWVDHGKPGGRRITMGPGAAMMDEKLFVVTDDGALWERHWYGTGWNWVSHGTPPGTRVATAPGAAMMDSKLFVGCADGRMFERHWHGSGWGWVDHGAPPGTRVATAPGAAMMDSKLFVGCADGRMFERHWHGSGWGWVDHGAPPGTAVATAPGAAMMNSKLFVGCADGRMFERHWHGTGWGWVDHGAPPGTGVASAPGAAMMDSKVFVSTADGRLFERHWHGSGWGWVDHGAAIHDQGQHVIGAPGTDPKLTIVVMGEGYAESELAAYRAHVDMLVVGSLRLDLLAAHQAAFRVVRVDLVSVEPGASERRYNADGSMASEMLRNSRLGIIPNDSWNRCWFDQSALSASRIDKVRRRFAPDADHVLVLVNSGTFGGCSSLGPGTALFTRGSGTMVVAHELGHNLFQLADEYAGDNAFTGVSRFANTSEALTDWTTLKWFDLVDAGTPLPTDEAAPPAGWNRGRSVGAFEGAGASFATGVFRPVLECRMNQNKPPWCPVCGRKIALDLEAFE
ncbi:MAG: hypothetical protein JNJ98_17045 [Gemmatimonadetes bacterium]|nr:hypothetical protein [Gemmatimonadota bacterium]